MMRFLLLAALLVCATPPTLAQSYDEQEAVLIEFIQNNQVGRGPDQWLVKDTFAGPTKTMLIFGYADDRGACLELASLYRERYPDAGYRCEAAQ